MITPVLRHERSTAYSLALLFLKFMFSTQKLFPTFSWLSVIETVEESVIETV